MQLQTRRRSRPAAMAVGVLLASLVLGGCSELPAGYPKTREAELAELTAMLDEAAPQGGTLVNEEIFGAACELHDCVALLRDYRVEGIEGCDDLAAAVPRVDATPEPRSEERGESCRIDDVRGRKYVLAVWRSWEPDNVLLEAGYFNF